MVNKERKILLLGGSYAQIPAIKAAREKGLYTILCDYLPDNPGQEIADKYINASTTHKEQILQIAQEHDIDYILAYASDPAATTAAYVSEKLGLPGNSYISVKTLSEKHLFRRLLSDLELNCPRVLSFTGEEITELKDFDIEYPLIVKPVDSSGSRGVRLIHSFSEFKKAAENALFYSRSRRIIIEEFINSTQGDIHGDGFVVNGKLVFSCLGDHIYDNSVNPFNPTGTFWPSDLSKEVLVEVNSQIKKIISATGFLNGAINIEARVTDAGRVYIMEIGPRSGGHFVPQGIKYVTNFDMVDASLSILLNEKLTIQNKIKDNVAYYAIHSNKEGVLKRITISKNIRSYIRDKHQYVKEGNEVKSFNGANAAIGILLMVFPDKKVMKDIIFNMDEHINVEVD